MKTLHKVGYGIGFITAMLLLAYGFYPQYDQFRLGLAAGGASLLIVIVIAWADHGFTEDSIKHMEVTKLLKLRPDLQITQKINNPPTNFLDAKEPDAPLGKAKIPEDAPKRKRVKPHGHDII